APSLPQLSAEQWCDLAMEIEASSPLEARAAYHHALDLDPAHVVARINPGRLLHAEGNVTGAEAHYRDAVRYDPTSALAWYNLGVLLEDTECPGEAAGCYERAVRLDPDLADAHYNLALLYERAGRARDAVKHLAIYRRLVPATHHPPAPAPRRGRARPALLSARHHPRPEARAAALPAAALPALRRRAARGLPRPAAPGREPRLRVPRRELVPGRDLRAPDPAPRRALHRRQRGVGHTRRGDGALRLPA